MIIVIICDIVNDNCYIVISWINQLLNMSVHSLKGKVAIIAGGAKNLGALTARVFAKEGASLMVHYHSDASEKQAKDLKKEIESLGGKIELFQGDLTKVASIQRLFKDTKEHFKRVDIAINTVGRVLKKPLVDTDEQEYDQMFDVNAKSAYFFMQEAGKSLEKNGKLITVLTSLLAAFTGHYSTYAGSKASVEHFTRAAAKEFAPRGISVTAVAPGPMDTPFFYPAEEQQAVEYHKSQAMNGQLTKIEDIVPILKFLATEGWWITGQTIFANGGYTTR